MNSFNYCCCLTTSLIVMTVDHQYNFPEDEDISQLTVDGQISILDGWCDGWLCVLVMNTSVLRSWCCCSTDCCLDVKVTSCEPKTGHRPPMDQPLTPQDPSIQHWQARMLAICWGSDHMVQENTTSYFHYWLNIAMSFTNF